MRAHLTIAGAVKQKLDTQAGYFMITDAHNHIVYASKGVEDKTAISMKEIIGKTPQQILYTGIKYRLPIYDKNHETEFYLEFDDTFQKLAKQIQQNPDIIEKEFVTPKEKKQIEEEKLVEAAQNNHELYGTLYQRYREKILQYFFHHVGGDMSIAEDLTEETFTKAFQQFSHFTITHASYVSYLLGAAHNILVNYYRTNKTISLEKLPQISFEESLSLSQKIECALVWEKIKNLSTLEQKVLDMKFHDDLAIAQIARHVNKSENAVKLILSRAQRKLKKMST